MPVPSNTPGCPDTPHMGSRSLPWHRCTPPLFFFGVAAVHGKGIQINRGVATDESAKVNGLAIVTVLASRL